MSNWEKAYLDEIECFIDEYLDDEYEDDEDKEILKNITDQDKRNIVEQLLNDDEINQAMNEAIRYYLFHIKRV